jgi:hypothetical protein
MNYVANYDEWKRIYEQGMGGMASPQTFADASTSSVNAAIKKLTSITFPQFMEGLREFLAGTTGIIVQVALDLFGGAFGKGLNVLAWSSLLVYDIQLGVNTGSWEWFNIILDAIGLATTGAGTTALKSIAPKIGKASRKTITGVAKAIAKASPKVYNTIKVTLVTISKFIGWISKNLGRLIKWIASKLKGTAVHKGLLGLQSLLSKSVPGILHKIESAFGHEAAHYVEHVAQHQAQHMASHSGAAAVTGGHGAGHGAKHGAKHAHQPTTSTSGKTMAQANVKTNKQTA